MTFIWVVWVPGSNDEKYENGTDYRRRPGTHKAVRIQVSDRKPSAIAETSGRGRGFTFALGFSFAFNHGLTFTLAFAFAFNLAFPFAFLHVQGRQGEQDGAGLARGSLGGF